MYFYKPYELIDEGVYNYIISDTNELLRSMHREDMIFFFRISFFFCLLGSIVISLIYEEIVMYAKPVIIANARLKSKELVTTSNGGYKGISYGYSYYLTFEIDNGTEIRFPVGIKYYTIILEGNKGILKYRQGAYNRFSSFYITEIE
jgi:hypothetical protein